MAFNIPGHSVAVPGLSVIGPHNPSHTKLATGLTRLALIKKDPRGTVDAVARRIGCADEAKQPLVFHRSIRERIP